MQNQEQSQGATKSSLKNMKVFVALSCLLAVSLASPTDEWHQFKTQYKKHFTNGDEETHRMNVFFNNKKKIEEHNAKFHKGEVTYTMKMNHLGDLEARELKHRFNGFKRSDINTNGRSFAKPAGVQVPASIDWRSKGAVTNISGPSCAPWAFSATGSLEGQMFLKTGKLVTLSEQNLIDCIASFGTMDQAFQYISDNGGIDTEDSYPSTGAVGSCKFDPRNVGGTCSGYVDIDSGDEDALKTAVGTIGPISVAIDASNWSFQFYSSGVYYDPGCSTDVDHYVLAVGYGTENGLDYWLVKNCWGENWGESGYIKMARNKNNNCGIATLASYPTV